MRHCAAPNHASFKPRARATNMISSIGQQHGPVAEPSSSSLERDARLTTTADHPEVSPGELAVGVVIGRTSEYFDFFVYGIASVLVFPPVFFPFVDRLQGTLYSFLVFAFAFVARPFGTALFMVLQRRFGRSTKLTAALFLLGSATAGMSFLPGYASLG